MAYAVDDSFDTWPEVIRIGSATAGLYVRCGAWIARNTQDGLVPAELAAMYGTKEWIQKLVDAGLWETEEFGYRDVYYHTAKDGAALNPTRETHLARKESARERTKRWREGQKTVKEQGKRAKKKRDASLTPYVTDTKRIRDASGDDSPSLPPPKGGRENARPATPGAARVFPEHPGSPPAPPNTTNGSAPPSPIFSHPSPTAKALLDEARTKAANASRKIHTNGRRREHDALTALTNAIIDTGQTPALELREPEPPTGAHP